MTTEQVWEQFHRQLEQFVAARIRDTMAVDDVVQTIFLKIHEHLPALRDDTHITGWVFQIARHAIIDYYRQPRLAPLPADSAERFVQPESERPPFSASLVACIPHIVAALSAGDQEALQLLKTEAMTQQGMALYWGISWSGAKSRVQRARQRFKAVFLRCCQHAEGTCICCTQSESLDCCIA